MDIKKINHNIKKRKDLINNLKWFIKYDAYQDERKAATTLLKSLTLNVNSLEKGSKKINDELDILKTLDNVHIYDNLKDLYDHKLSNSDDDKSDYKALMIELEHLDLERLIIEVTPGNGLSYWFNDPVEAYDFI